MKRKIISLSSGLVYVCFFCFFVVFFPYSLLLCKSYWSATTSWKKALGKKWNTKCFKFQFEKRGVKLKYSLEKGLQFSNFLPMDRWRVFSTIYNQFSKQNYLNGPVFNNVIKLNYSLSMNHSTSKAKSTHVPDLFVLGIPSKR